MLTAFIAKGRDLILWTSQFLRIADVILFSSIPYKVTFKEEGRREKRNNHKETQRTTIFPGRTESSVISAN